MLWGYEDEGTHFWHRLLVPEGEYSPSPRTVFWVSPNSGSFLEGPTQKLAFVLPDSVFPGLGGILLKVLKGSSTDSGSLGKGQRLGQTAEVQKACEERSWGRINMAERHLKSSYSVLGNWESMAPAQAGYILRTRGNTKLSLLPCLRLRTGKRKAKTGLLTTWLSAEEVQQSQSVVFIFLLKEFSKATRYKSNIQKSTAFL